MTSTASPSSATPQSAAQSAALPQPTLTLQLEDIHQPDPVSFWPLAPGWWLLLALSIVLALCLRYAQKRWVNPWQSQRQLNKHAREAVLHGYQDWQSHRDISRFCAEVNTQLKRYCRKQAPAALPLSGEDWVNWMESCSGIRFNPEQRLALASGPYQPVEHLSAVNADSLRDAVLTWLDKAAFQSPEEQSPEEQSPESQSPQERSDLQANVAGQPTGQGGAS